ncbi:MAG TPA: zinc ribbon domain-containing protein [Dehalococcoidia bacterium]|jgi:putative FmdB family regulatory protein|nr:zinc ribbon domain-containing protein [Dehalococcoidia bacterium]
MPVYDYECNLCNFRFEKRQRFDEEPLAICPKCQGKLRRIIHSTPVLFKGSGFYVTDSRKGTGTEGTAERKPDQKPHQVK